MPVKHSLVGVLHKQGRLGRVLVKGYVIRTERMPQDVTELAQSSLLEGLLLLPIVDRPANLPVVAHIIGRLDPCPQVLGEPLQNLALS